MVWFSIRKQAWNWFFQSVALMWKACLTGHCWCLVSLVYIMQIFLKIHPNFYTSNTNQTLQTNIPKYINITQLGGVSGNEYICCSQIATKYVTTQDNAVWVFSYAENASQFQKNRQKTNMLTLALLLNYMFFVFSCTYPIFSLTLYQKLYLDR